MNERTSVKIIDLDTMEVTEIPLAELSDQMVPARIQGRPGFFWVDIHQAMGRSKAVLHPTFSGVRRQRVEAIASMFGEIYPQSYEQWELGFRRDSHPDQEIAIWLRSGKIFTEFSRRRGLDLHQRKALARLLFQCQAVSFDQLKAVRTNPDLPKEICDDFINEYYERGARPATTAADVLENPELLGPADVIYAANSRSGGRTLLHGADLLEAVVTRNSSAALLVATVWYRDHAEFRAICRIVRKFKKGT